MWFYSIICIFYQLAKSDLNLISRLGLFLKFPQPQSQYDSSDEPALVVITWIVTQSPWWKELRDEPLTAKETKVNVAFAYFSGCICRGCMYATLRDSIINVSAILNISRDKYQFLYDM